MKNLVIKTNYLHKHGFSGALLLASIRNSFEAEQIIKMLKNIDEDLENKYSYFNINYIIVETLKRFDFNDKRYQSSIFLDKNLIVDVLVEIFYRDRSQFDIIETLKEELNKEEK